MKREDGKDVIQEINFRNARPDGYVENPDAPGQWVTPKYLEVMRAQLAEAVRDRTEAAKLPPEVKALAEELAVLHLPEHKVDGRKTADATRVEIYQSTRMAAYIHDRGYRFHPEHEQIRWVATPNGPTRDMGIHIERNADGTWPVPDPEDFYDSERIAVAQTPTGKWIASHPCGVYAEAKTKARAHANVVQQLLAKIEGAQSDDE